MNRRRRRRFATPLLALVALSCGAAQADTLLPVTPIAQAQPGWSWAAVSRMIMDYYDVPAGDDSGDSQCAIANFLAGRDDCSAPTGLGAYQATLKAIQGYSRAVFALTEQGPDEMRYQEGKVLPPEELIHEMQLERPVVVAIQPPKVNDADKDTRQVALIVGYAGDAGNLQIIVNDPKLYDFGYDPYTDAGGRKRDVNGQYLIGYNDFIQQMKWTATIFRVKPE
jgi:hypothetical protein